MAKEVYQIKVTLKRTKPPIWRRLFVSSTVTLRGLHRILQTTMGWTNSHLHLFDNGIEEYSPAEFEVEYAEDSGRVPLKKLLNKKNPKILYLYDFGDYWEHDIVLENVLPYDSTMRGPVCTAGRRNCPPEDCGGIPGFKQMLEALKNPGDEEYDSYTEWLGEVYNPYYFDRDRINKLLQQKNYGCIWL